MRVLLAFAFLFNGCSPLNWEVPKKEASISPEVVRAMDESLAKAQKVSAPDGRPALQEESQTYKKPGRSLDIEAIGVRPEDLSDS